MKKPSRRQLRDSQRNLRNAHSYSEWLDAAKAYDELHGYDVWRRQDQSPFYPYELLKEQIETLQRFRRQGRPDLLVPYLQESLHRTLGELAEPRLYHVSMAGTKHLVENYLDEIESMVDYLCDTDFEFIDKTQKQLLFKHARKNFGRSALMLSAGGAFGICHFGVIKTLLHHGLLPEVVAGSSMGAIVTGFIGTHRDEQILKILSEPENQHFMPVSWRKLGAMLEGQSLMQPDQLMECIRSNIPDDTFLEAYQKTGRVINITVSPTRSGQKPRILNYKTAANVLVRYACKASASIPIAFPPVQLMAKSAEGELIPYMASELWADGGVSTDIPMGRMGRLHNINHFIVSQTNPHVLPFVTNRNRPGLVPYLADLASASVHAQLHQFIVTSKKRIPSREARVWLDRADSLLGQDYLGDINLHPEFPLKRYLNILSNPSMAEVHEYILAGERSTWPKLAMIRNQTRISRVLRRCAVRLEET